MTTHIWNIVSNKESLWVRWIHTYNLKGRSFWDVPLKCDVSWGWLKLLQLHDFVTPYFWTKTGNGKDISAWFDVWCEDFPLIRFLSPRDFAREGLISTPSIDDNKVDVHLLHDSNGVMSKFSIKAAWEAFRPRGNVVPIMNPQETEQVIARDELWVPTAERVMLDWKPQRHVPKILMQQFWYTITKIKGSESYEFLLADKRRVIDAVVFRKILDICPRKEGKDFTEVHTNIFVDHMHQPWRTLAACINKCLSGKTASNDKLRKSRIDILREKKSRRENMPYPRFTKVIIDYFLSKHKSLKKLKFQHFHTIKDDGVNHTRGSSCILLVKYLQRRAEGKGSQGKKTADPTEESIDVSNESKPKPLI
ncbi:hypothetical protein Tco_1426615, partial [Tanacetum coccineum]